MSERSNDGESDRGTRFSLLPRPLRSSPPTGENAGRRPSATVPATVPLLAACCDGHWPAFLHIAVDAQPPDCFELIIFQLSLPIQSPSFKSKTHNHAIQILGPPLMACSPSHHLLSCHYHLPNHKSPQFGPFLELPTKSWAHKNYPTSNSAVNLLQVEEEAKDRPRFRWVETAPDKLTKEQNMGISRLPKKMEKRCKALMRQIICFSSEKGSFSDMLAAWVKIMKPKRADWLAVLKELTNMDHPLLLLFFEHALLEESFEANIRDYTKMIHLYANRDQLQDAEELLVAMKRKGFTCDQVTLTTMIHMYSKAGNFKLAEETFEEMKLLGKPLDKRAYGSMIMAYIRAGMSDKGEDLINEMERQEIYASREVYKALLRTYSMKGDAEGAQRVFDAIQVGGIFPDVKLCTLLINAYVLAGQSHKALVAFENMRRAGVKPSDKCVALLLSSYEKEKKINSAMHFLVNLEKEGIMIGEEASEVLVGWFRRLGIVEDITHIL